MAGRAPSAGSEAPAGDRALGRPLTLTLRRPRRRPRWYQAGDAEAAGRGRAAFGARAPPGISPVIQGDRGRVSAAAPGRSTKEEPSWPMPNAQPKLFGKARSPKARAR